MVAVLATAMAAFAGCEEDAGNNGNGSTNNGGGTASVGWVDLGLPSGLLWASCNVGASAPEQYGYHFAWAETQPKRVYDWSTYAYGNDYNQLTKYCGKSALGLNGFTDNLTTLQPGDDAATASLGSVARTPTYDEWFELMDNTTAEWMPLNGVNGRKCTAANGNSIFLPDAGYRYGAELYDAGSHGYYWSASLDSITPDGAWEFGFGSDVLNDQRMGRNDRCNGLSVRAVRSIQN